MSGRRAARGVLAALVVDDAVEIVVGGETTAALPPPRWAEEQLIALGWDGER